MAEKDNRPLKDEPTLKEELFAKQASTGETGAEKKSKLSPAAMRALKILYIVLFSISALIVIVYLIVTFAIRPPEQNEPPVITATVSPGVSSGEGEDVPGEQVITLERREQVYTCLIFGMDDGYGNTDTIMVATFDVPNQKIGLVSIPRDTVVSLEKSAAMNKVNAAYSSNGVEGLKAEVSQLLGIPIDYYVKIRLSAFEKLVNAIGGVWFEVPFNMDYEDPYQDLSIHLTAGYQLLNGNQAMGLVRYRQDNNMEGYGDVGRAGTQQAFMKAMLSQVLSGASLDTIPDLVDILVNYVETDAGVNDMLYFGRALVGMDLGSALKMETLPSRWSYPYMWVESEEALAVVNELLNPYTTGITLEMVEFFTQ